MNSREVVYSDGEVEIVFVTHLPEEGGVERVSRGGRVLEQARVSLEESFSTARIAADTLRSQFAAAISPPNEVELEFGLSFSGSASVVVSTMSTEANLRVKCTWKNAT